MRAPGRRFLASAAMALCLVLTVTAGAAGADQNSGVLQREAGNAVGGRAAVLVGLVVLGAVLAFIILRRGSRVPPDEGR